MTIGIDKRVQINKIIESQLPEFVRSDFENATEFFKQYYISQEFQGGPSDLIDNLDQYLKSDNLVPEVVYGKTTLSSSIDASSTTLSVTSTKGYPDEYGLLKIDDEIISYTGKTDTEFTGLIRGFSGVTGYNVGIATSFDYVNRQNLKFEDTSSASHASGAEVTNLSVLFIQEFYKKLKKTFLPGLENNDFTKDLDVGNFIKHARSFYQSKGIEESIRILMKVLFGEPAVILDLEERLIKPSSAEYIRREVIVADRISGDPQKLVGQTITKSTDPSTTASVSEVEIFTRSGISTSELKSYFKISLFVGYNDRDLIEGTFTIPGKTKVQEPVSTGSSIITVDSTIGFGQTGYVLVGDNTVTYGSKSVNQFFDCEGISANIGIGSDVRSDEVIFGYEDGDITKRVELRITGVLSEFETVSDISLVNEGQRIYVKNVGEKILNPTNEPTYKQIFANSWIYNTSSRYQIREVSGSTLALISPIDKSSLKVGDSVEILQRNSDNVVAPFALITNIDVTRNEIIVNGLSAFTPLQGLYYDIRRKLNKASSNYIEIKGGNDQVLSDVLNLYSETDKNAYVASNSLPSYDLPEEVKIQTTISDDIQNELEGYVATTFDYDTIIDGTGKEIPFITGDEVVYDAGGHPLTGLTEGNAYFIEVINKNPGKIRLYLSRGLIGHSASAVRFKPDGLAFTATHKFLRKSQFGQKLAANDILRKFPLTQNLFVSGTGETVTNQVGMLIDGVEITTPISGDAIYYGPIDQVQVFNEGEGYDVINPPNIKLDRSTNGGVDAVAEAVVEGSVDQILVDPHRFDIDDVVSISLVGGNGTGCKLEPVMGTRFRELNFDSRDIFFSGGLSKDDETITFKEPHFLSNGQVVFYNSNGNSPIGTGPFKSNSNVSTGSLATGAPYNVRVVNSRTVQLYETRSDALSGINTIGISTATNASGIHKFRTASRRVLQSVRVIEPGSGYSNRKVRALPKDVSLAYDTIHSKNHGFGHGDLVEYSISNTGTTNNTSSVYYTIGLESWTSTHKAPILFTQALNDGTGGGNQAAWLQDYYDDIVANGANATATIKTVDASGHAEFAQQTAEGAILQSEIRNFIGSSNPSGPIANAQFPIVPADGETHTIDGTSYPVMGKLYVPTGVAASSLDVVVVFHGTVGSGSIADAAQTALDTFLNTTTLNVRDKIIFAAAYPQDHISSSLQFNLPGVGTETPTFLMGDNLPYARAAVGWVQNSLNAYIAAQGGTKTINDVYLFGHSQGGKLVAKINTLDTGIAGVISNAPGPIQFDQTCSTATNNYTCDKVAAIHGAPGGIGGLNLNNQYYVIKIDDDSFRLADAGTTQNIDNFKRNNYINFTSQGTEQHTFAYPEIKVEAEVSFSSTVSGTLNFTPVVTGKITDVKLSNSGTKYGSTILNHTKTPSVSVETGDGGVVRLIIVDGRIDQAQVLNKGRNYFSVPDIVVTSTDGKTGNGAILRAVINDLHQLVGVRVINPGIGYVDALTEVTVVSRGKNCVLNPRIRKLTVDSRIKNGNYDVSSAEDGLALRSIGYTPTIADSFDDVESRHSPIIGWAYDGNPIYGPFGFTNPSELGPNVKILTSGYSLDASNVVDRPSTNEFAEGYFVDDWSFTGNGDLDIHNGRFCKTNEFPNGVYAYFASVTRSTQSNVLEPSFPYYIGKTYRSPYIKDNSSLNQKFDFNNSKLSRNTFPYKVGDQNADNDFIIESNETLRQLSTIEAITVGEIDDIVVLDGGSSYKVGDVTSFDDTNTNGTGLRAQVKSLVGFAVTALETDLDRYENAVFKWIDDQTVEATYHPYYDFLDETTVNISGLNKTVVHLQDTFTVGVKTETIGLAKSMTANPVVTGRVEDIYVDRIPSTVSVGSTIKINDDELISVLNIYPIGSILRVKRFGVGIAHTYGSKLDPLARTISIPVQTKKFESSIQDKIFFNAHQSVGVGTTAGGGISVEYVVGESKSIVPIPTRQIYLPNHPFTHGQELKFVKNGTATSLLVGPESGPNGLFNLPNVTTDISTVYVVDKGQDYIGITTIKSGIGTVSEGLFFHSNGSDDFEYYFESKKPQVIGDVDSITTKVFTTVDGIIADTHGLENGDKISLNVVPSTIVGLGSTAPISLSFNEEHQKLLINKTDFADSDINIVDSSISINNHGYSTGDRVFYTGNAAGLIQGSYYIYEINSNKFSFGQTLSDVTAEPANLINITSQGSGTHSVALINPRLTSTKNGSLAFDLTDTTLQGYELKFFYDEEFKNEFTSTKDNDVFNVSGVGTAGIGTDGRASIKYSGSSPTKIYYGLEKAGYISTADNLVQNNSQIQFVESAYNGDYSIFGITTNTFNVSPRNMPELLSYVEDQCETIEYSTESTAVSGAIKDLRIISKGQNYKQVPRFKEVVSVNGNNANIVALSTSIGRIDRVRIVDVGFEYPSDKTLSPEAFVSPTVRIDDVDVIKEINVIDGGKEYLSAPDLIVYDPEKNEIVDESSLLAITPNQAVSEVEIIAPIQGLNSVNHRVIAINNSNGVGISSMEGGVGIVTCNLETPINGFAVQPFAVGDEIFVEGIELYGEDGLGIVGNTNPGGITTGTGFNSEDYNYQFFKVTEYTPSNPAILKFSIAGLTTNPGIAKTFQSGYATIVNKKNYPQFNVVQERGLFLLKEKLYVLKDTGKFELTDLEVVNSRDDFIKIDGIFPIRAGDRVRGANSNVSATITDIVDNQAKFIVDYASRQEIGWADNVGKLSEDFQVVPDNNYFQNLSYSIKSPITWDQLVNPVNRLVHPAGLKNFADVGITSSIDAGFRNVPETDPVIVIDVIGDKRVDTINNFDFARDYDARPDVNPTKSKFATFDNIKLTDFTLCKSNRVLIHDDISGSFASKGFQDVFTEIEEVEKNYAKYLVQIVDADTLNVQISELVVLTTTNDAILIDRTSDFSSIELGEFEATSDSFSRKALNFKPVEKYNRDHDIKVLKTDFASNALINGEKNIGNVKLFAANVKVAIAQTDTNDDIVGFTTTTIASFNDTEFRGFVADVLVQDDITRKFSYAEVTVDFDGTDVYYAESYVDSSNEGYSASRVGVLTARYDSNAGKVFFECENQTKRIINLNSNIVGLANTSVGVGTHRFAVPGQPIGAERSARLESTNFKSPNGDKVLISRIDNTKDSSVKSIFKVSTASGESSIHQAIFLQNDGAVTSIQYPFTGKDNTGIGTVGSQIVGDFSELYFYPDIAVTNEVEVQAYNTIFNTIPDFFNTPDPITIGPAETRLFLSAYDGVNGTRANKINFPITHKGDPVYGKFWNPNDTNQVNYETGEITIPNHFFNTNEELVYTPGSTFVGVGSTAVSIGSTTNHAGIVTDIMPEKVYVKVFNENKFFLYSRPEYVNSGIAITFTGTGEGNAHKFDMTQKLTKTVIGLDGIVQQPITFTSIKHSIRDSIGIGVSQFVLSGISSVQPRDVLKVGPEYMKIEQVGFSSLPQGTINDSDDVAAGICTLPVVRVRRGSLGIAATTHLAGADARVHRGSFNIVDSTVWFLDPPKGNSRARRDDSNLPYVKAEFSGRTFLRQDYTTNMIFDDISDTFTGVGKTYTMTVGGANTESGVAIGNGIVFINGVFQTPLTLNNAGNNYELITTPAGGSGISSVVFTGISSENGQPMQSQFDINQNQLPRGGLIVSLGSTPGLGYAPLVGANVKANLEENPSNKFAANSITSITGIPTTSNVKLGIQTAAYDFRTGIITVTTNAVHGFALQQPSTVQLDRLEFSCSSEHAGVTTTFFQDHDRALPIVGIISATTFEVNAGVCTINHVYEGGGDVIPFFNDLTFGSGYRDPVGIGLTDIEFEHKFIKSVGNAITINGSINYSPTKVDYRSSTGELIVTVNDNHTIAKATEHTVTFSTYDPVAGTATFTVGNHGFSNGDFVKIKDNSIRYKCTMDADILNPGGVSVHAYPRVTDPISGRWVPISNVTANEFTVTVGTSPLVSFTPTNAFYDENTGMVELQIGQHNLKPGTNIKLANGSILFTSDKDDNTTTEAYPRVGDPSRDTSITIESVTPTTIVVKLTNPVPVGINKIRYTFTSASADSVSTGGDYAHSFFTADTNGLLRAVDTATIATNSLVFTCDRDDHESEHPYPRSTDPAAGVTLGIEDTSFNTITLNVGTGGGGGTGAILDAEVGTNKHRFVSADPNSIFIDGGGNLSPTDATYDPATGELVVTAASHGVGSATTVTPTAATYVRNTGNLTLTVANHGFQVGDKILIEDNSLVFTCTKDFNQTEHSYPRSTDYASGKWLTIANATTNTFRVNVNPSPSAEQYTHTFVKAQYNGSVLKSNGAVTIIGGSMVFTCAQDAYQTLHPYPRTTDPAYNTLLPVGKTTTNTIRLMVGKSPAGTGGALEFTLKGYGARFVNPDITTPEPNYENMPIVGISRLGVGKTTDTGSNLLMNLDVTQGSTNVGTGRSFFEISKFQIAREGHSFAIGDKFTPVGLVVDKRLQKPLDRFELEVVNTFNDFFSAWQFGELDFIDDIAQLQTGSRKRFPLFRNGQLLSFEVDEESPLGESIDLNAVLVIFVNGVLQTPNYAYQFEGGTTFQFTEAPSTKDKVDVFFYKGTDGVDVQIVNINETIKVGDDIRIRRSDTETNTQEQITDRIIKDIRGSDLVETTMYRGPGITETISRPVDWTKQKEDRIIKGDLISKAREVIEPQIYPTAKVIGDIKVDTGIGLNGGIFVDDAEAFFYEDLANPALESEDRYGVNITAVDAILFAHSEFEPAVIRPEVNFTGQVDNYVIDNAGNGYVGAAVTLHIGAPIGVGIGTTVRDQFAVAGVSTFAAATANIVNGKVDSVTIDNVGFGYTNTSLPGVTLTRTPVKYEKLLSYNNVEGYTGIITGIGTAVGSAGAGSLALKFFYTSLKSNANKLQVGYPILIKDTTISVGAGLTSVDGADSNIVAIGSTFLDNIYKVSSFVQATDFRAEITCDILSNTEEAVGLASTGFYNPTNIGLTTSLGTISWGRIYNGERDSNPISIGVTGLTVDAGLSTFPTIQRRYFEGLNSEFGLRNSGSIRVVTGL